VATGVGALALGPAHAEGDKNSTKGRGHVNRTERAQRALSAITTNFPAPTDQDMLAEFHPRQDDDPEFTYCWPLSQVRSAVIETLQTCGGSAHREVADLNARLRRAQEQYWLLDGPTGVPAYTAATNSEEGANGDVFYDDNAWVALLESEEYLATHGRRGDLGKLRDLVELARTAEDTDDSHPHPGGIYWAEFTKGRNTCSTAPNAKAALRLHQITGEDSFLEDAERWNDWNREVLLSPEDGLFRDNIGEDGSIDETYWAYNQGVPLGVEALLFTVTRKRTHRDRALELYDAIVDHYDLFGTGAAMEDEPLQFAAILTGNLVMAEALIGPRIQGRTIARAYADALWDDFRDPETDLYNGPKTEGGDRLGLLAQAGFARAQAIAALPLGTAKVLG
jgi:hypothetical protein